MVLKEALRIGNSLYLSKVAEILDRDVILRSTLNGQQDITPLSALQPILIDGGILMEAYGFVEQQRGADLLCGDGFCLRQVGDGWAVSSSSYPTTRTFHFLHELENTFFALNHREIPVYKDGKRVVANPPSGIQTELQIGNFINGKKVSGPGEAAIQVHELRRGGITYQLYRAVHSGGGIEIKQELNPDEPMLYGWGTGLPVTPHWLQLFGGKPLNDHDPVYRLGPYTVRLSGPQVVLQDGNHHFGQPFQYVHQLQNLYFALSGQTLTLTEQ